MTSYGFHPCMVAVSRNTTVEVNQVLSAKKGLFKALRPTSFFAYLDFQRGVRSFDSDLPFTLGMAAILDTTFPMHYFFFFSLQRTLRAFGGGALLFRRHGNGNFSFEQHSFYLVQFACKDAGFQTGGPIAEREKARGMASGDAPARIFMKVRFCFTVISVLLRLVMGGIQLSLSRI